MTVQEGPIHRGRILVTGGTGYVGGRLIPLLLERGYRVRVLARDPQKLRYKPWAERVEVVQGDALQPPSLTPALEGVETAYYLIHSMVGSAGYWGRDCRAALNFSEVAKAAVVKRLIYLGGLGDPGTELSDHLRSRQLTGDLLRESGIPVTEFRAAVIIGSGSASFEMIRYLAEGLPVVLYPRWVSGLVQPIAIRDVLAYLVASLEHPESTHQIVEIGGADVLSYREVLGHYADLRDLRRLLLPLPGMSPRICARMVDWLTPIPASLAAPLIEGLRNDSIVRDDLARRLFPSIEPMGIEAALLRALAYLQTGKVETTWRDAFTPEPKEEPGLLGTTRQGVIRLRFEQSVRASQAILFDSLLRLGSSPGWGFRNPLWRLVQAMGSLTGGGEPARPRRGRAAVREDDVVDGWRVVSLDRPQSIRLMAEWHAGGTAWTVFEVQPLTEGRCLLTLSAYFTPHGFWGVLYWYLLAPARSTALRGIMRQIARFSEDRTRSDVSNER
jgi:uncharacterized protein YbjT (DUF2867 family)